MTQEDKDRFYKKFDIGQDCWNWTAGLRGKSGYGAFKYKGKVLDAHRLSYKLHKGEIPEGLLVCHTCDNRRCVNPDHLWLGSYRDNWMDAVTKGRASNPMNQDKIKHPSISAYRKGCRCNECREIKRISDLNYKMRNCPLI